jgi:hypothetical protein
MYLLIKCFYLQQIEGKYEENMDIFCLFSVGVLCL